MSQVIESLGGNKSVRELQNLNSSTCDHSKSVIRLFDPLSSPPVAPTVLSLTNFVRKWRSEAAIRDITETDFGYETVNQISRDNYEGVYCFTKLIWVKSCWI
jgi:hypothetical protein